MIIFSTSVQTTNPSRAGHITQLSKLKYIVSEWYVCRTAGRTSDDEAPQPDAPNRCIFIVGDTHVNSFSTDQLHAEAPPFPRIEQCRSYRKARVKSPRSKVYLCAQSHGEWAH